ncbi:hypothetical protein [Limobrevibacterium gyesilva]|uniref:Uncharacterized protein n=1 Tax=Limobrevibacterium gyesilva TaxID=2991712 RepID=A0AA42CKB4_9PROT|nr:hypothetical protein [Limobrevibacterium gyesilva]MCW3477737.1 hypothetical protein [Limobrevibacterium gyesilva]
MHLPTMARRHAADIAITAFFVAFMVARIADHAMWRDELNAWGIVLASPTPAALFHNMHYEGHPALWHMLLWLTAKITAAPAAMKVVHAAIAAGVIVMVGLVSPFSRLERVLLLAGYFISYEYSVISRNYGICLLLALVYAQLRIARPDRLFTNAALLGLMANTNVYGAILSGALALEYLVDRVATARRPGARLEHRLLSAAMLYLLGFALAVATMAPAADIGWEVSQPLTLHASPGHFLKTFLRFIAVPFVPIKPALLSPAFWLHPNEHDGIASLWLPILIAGVLCAGIAAIFRRDRVLWLPIGLAVAGSVIFGHLVYSTGIRHWGISFIIFLTALWMQRMRRPGRSALVLALLAIGAAGGLQAAAAQWIAPHSMAGATARWIERHQLQDAALVGTPDTTVVAVAEELGRPIYMLECGCVRSYMRFSRDRDGFTPDRIPVALARAASALRGRDVLFVVTSPLAPPLLDAIAQQALRLTLLTAQTGARTDENFYLYRVEQRP